MGDPHPYSSSSSSSSSSSFYLHCFSTYIHPTTSASPLSPPLSGMIKMKRKKMMVGKTKKTTNHFPRFYPKKKKKQQSELNTHEKAKGRTLTRGLRRGFAGVHHHHRRAPASARRVHHPRRHGAGEDGGDGCALRSLTRPFGPLIHSLDHSLVHSLVHSFVHWSIHTPLTHSLSVSIACRVPSEFGGVG